MATSKVDGNLHVTEALIVSGEVNVPDGSFANADLSATAAIATSKMLHHHKVNAFLAGTASTKTIAVLVVTGATGTIKRFSAGALTPCTGIAQVIVDLKKNGTSILDATLTLSSSQAARGVVDATIQTAVVVEDDVLEVMLTVAAYTDTSVAASGVFATVGIDEVYPT